MSLLYLLFYIEELINVCILDSDKKLCKSVVIKDIYLLSLLIFVFILVCLIALLIYQKCKNRFLQFLNLPMLGFSP